MYLNNYTKANIDIIEGLTLTWDVFKLKSYACET